ncbi:unnamed protein product, partial [Rotaria magnacalcarata]
ETLTYRFKNQISSFVIGVTGSDEANSREIIRLIFTNLRYLNFD